MAAPKSIKSESAVAPVAPAEAMEADVADPGEAAAMEFQQAQASPTQVTEQKAKPFKPREPAQPGEEVQTSWIEIELVGEDDKPIAGEQYRMTMSDGSVQNGTLDERGFARVEGMEAGTVKVTFPNLDKDAWEKK